METLAPLTALESRILKEIQRFIKEHGQSPTIAELALSLRLKSKGTVHRYVQSLIEKRRLEKHGNGWRGLRIAEEASAAHISLVDTTTNQNNYSDPKLDEDQLATVTRINNSNFTSNKNAQSNNIVDLVRLPTSKVTSGDFRIPLLGQIAAGQPIEAIEDQQHLDLAAFFIGPDRYALRVTGDSMMDVGILDGDTVILRKTSKARPGDIVVALIDRQEATLKRLGQVDDGMVELIPENASMKSMRYSADRVSFQGVLVGQLRSY